MRSPFPNLLQVAALCLVTACAQTASAPAPAPATGLLSTLQVTRTEEMVTFDLQVTNTMDRAVQFVFPDGQTAEFVVERTDGSEVWRWSDGQMFTQAIQSETLAPDESWRAVGQWNPPPDLAGEFVARGWVTARDLRVEQATRFRLP